MNSGGRTIEKYTFQNNPAMQKKVIHQNNSVMQENVIYINTETKRPTIIQKPMAVKSVVIKIRPESNDIKLSPKIVQKETTLQKEKRERAEKLGFGPPESRRSGPQNNPDVGMPCWMYGVSFCGCIVLIGIIWGLIALMEASAPPPNPNPPPPKELTTGDKILFGIFGGIVLIIVICFCGFACCRDCGQNQNSTTQDRTSGGCPSSGGCDCSGCSGDCGNCGGGGCDGCSGGGGCDGCGGCN